MEEVKVVRFFKAFDWDSIKLAIGITAGTASYQVLQHIQTAIIKDHSKARKLIGTAPPGQVENLLQGYLEKASSGRHGEEQA
jgi:hypothetical protein